AVERRREGHRPGDSVRAGPHAREAGGLLLGGLAVQGQSVAVLKEVSVFVGERKGRTVGLVVVVAVPGDDGGGWTARSRASLEEGRPLERIGVEYARKHAALVGVSAVIGAQVHRAAGSPEVGEAPQARHLEGSRLEARAVEEGGRPRLDGLEAPRG